MPVAVNDGDHGPRDVPKTAVKEVTKRMYGEIVMDTLISPSPSPSPPKPKPHKPAPPNLNSAKGGKPFGQAHRKSLSVKRFLWMSHFYPDIVPRCKMHSPFALPHHERARQTRSSALTSSQRQSDIVCDSSHTSDLGLVCAPRPRPTPPIHRLDDTRSLPERPYPRHASRWIRIRRWIFANLTRLMPSPPRPPASPRVPSVPARPPNRSTALSPPHPFARVLPSRQQHLTSAILEDLRPGTSYGGGTIAFCAPGLNRLSRTVDLSPCTRQKGTSTYEDDPELVHPPHAADPSLTSTWIRACRSRADTPALHPPDWTTGASVYGRSAFPMDPHSAHPVHPPGANPSLTSPPAQQIDPSHSYSVDATRF
ncbi:hypothetical protein DFH07DRAFT_946054 [Mycena maculata]|uniref:Uncharacterized protein n=1 Tax=Mycena maculata TaxID=230809 RepID=A0AAD7HSX6_9AGAR|nr:hypothetical protein DFH07DRAFT_946054 [Mycena maculata]